MNKRLLIAGIDPGTTVGYALIDLKGNAVSIGSEKHLKLDSLIAKTVAYGKVIAVGTDKAKVPGFVEKFANALGARIIKPEADLLSREKAELTAGYDTDDDHQLDALGAALLSFKKLRTLIKKVQNYIEEYGKEAIASKLFDLVISKGMSIRLAAGLLEKPEKEEEKIVAKAINEMKFEEKNFLKLYSKLKQIEKENELLRQHDRNLRKELASMEKPKEKKTPYEKTFNKLLRQREKRFFILERELRSKDDEIDTLEGEINKICGFLSSLSENILLKKLANLGMIEFEKKEPLLKISNEDVLLVDDPNIVSDKAVAKIKDKVHVIVYNKKPGRKISGLSFIFIDAKKLDIEENQYFAVTNRKAFEKEKSKVDVLDKVISDYRKERLG